MRSWLLVFLWIVLIGGVVFAQDQAPLASIGSLEAGDFRALAVTADGDRLLAADAENQQVRIYDFGDPANPALLWTLDLSGTPVLLVGGADYGLVAVTTDADTDALEVVAPILPGTPYSTGIYLDIPKNPHSLAISPDNHWGIVVGDTGYVLLKINGADDIESLTVHGDIPDVALGNTVAYVLHGDSLVTARLNALEALQSSDQSLDLSGTPSLVRVNSAVTEGVIVVDGSRLVFFDPDSLKQIGEFTVEGSPITDARFLTNGDTQYLLVTQEDTDTIALFDATDPSSVRPLRPAPALDHPVQALTVFDHYLIATDGATIRILST